MSAPARSCRCTAPFEDGDSCFTCGLLLPGQVGEQLDAVAMYDERAIREVAGMRGEMPSVTVELAGRPDQ